MKTKFFRFLAKVNKGVFPSYSKKNLDLAKSNMFQKAIIGWRLWVSKHAGNPMKNDDG